MGVRQWSAAWAALVLLLSVALAAPVGVLPAAHAKGKTRIVVGMPGGSAAHAPEIVARFEQLHPDVEVEPLILDWGGFFDKLLLMLVSGVAPDVWYGEAGRALGWHYYGFTLDLKPYVDRDLDLDQYFLLDAAVDPRTGAWTGIPSDFQVTSLFYNTEHFLSGGLNFPDEGWTLADLVDAAKKLTVPLDQEALRWGFNLQPDYITAGWMLWMKLLGGQILDPTRTGSRLLDPANVRALETMLALMYEQRVSPTPGMYAFAPWEAAVSFQEGRTSMMFNIYSWNRQLATAGMESYDVAVTPAGVDGRRFTTAVPNVWVINAASSKARQEAAWRWITFQIGEEAQRIRMATGAGVPVNRGVAFEFAELPFAPLNRRIYLDSYAFAGTLEENPVWAEYRQAIEAELPPVWANETTPEAALLRAHQQVQRILESIS